MHYCFITAAYIEEILNSCHYLEKLDLENNIAEHLNPKIIKNVLVKNGQTLQMVNLSRCDEYDLNENFYYKSNINIPNQEELDHLYWAKERNKLNIWMVNEVIMQFTGRKEKGENQINLYDMLPKAYNGSKECNEACWEFKKAIINSFIKADVLASISDIENFGTLLRLFSDEIGISFQNDPIAPYEYPCKDCWEKCYAIDEIENLIHKVMKKIASHFGLKASLHDVPNAFGNGYVYPLKTLFYPLYSICNAGNIFMMKLVS